MSRLRDSKLGRAYRFRISNWPNYQCTPSGGLGYWIKLRIRVFSSLFSSVLRISREEIQRLQISRRSLGTYTGKVLVVANGPSASQLSVDQLKKFVAEGGKIVAMNGYVFSALAEEIIPDFYFLADPDIWSQPLPNDRKFAERLDHFLSGKWSGTTVVQPVHQRKISQSHSKYLYLTHLNSSGLWPFKNPFLLWGLAPSTLLLAFAAVKKLGFSSVYFAGVDGDSYRYFYIDSRGDLNWNDEKHHFYSSPNTPNTEIEQSSFQGIKLNTDVFSTIGDFLYAEAILRRDFEKLSKGAFINLTPTRYFDLGIRSFGQNE